MNNKFINYNGETLLHTKNKKTKVEIQSIVVDQSQIEKLKQQKQEILKELSSWETKNKELDKLLANLAEVDKFSTEFLTKLVKTEKEQENCDDYRLEQLIKDKVSFALKFEPASEVFYKLIWQKIEFQICQLRSKLNDIQKQLLHQERIFARMEIRRQNRVLLTCQYKNRLGCLVVYRCDNCQANYSVNSQAVAEIASP